MSVEIFKIRKPAYHISLGVQGIRFYVTPRDSDYWAIYVPSEWSDPETRIDQRWQFFLMCHLPTNPGDYWNEDIFQVYDTLKALMVHLDVLLQDPLADPWDPYVGPSDHSLGPSMAEWAQEVRRSMGVQYLNVESEEPFTWRLRKELRENTQEKR